MLLRLGSTAELGRLSWSSSEFSDSDSVLVSVLRLSDGGVTPTGSILRSLWLTSNPSAFDSGGLKLRPLLVVAGATVTGGGTVAETGGASDEEVLGA